MPEAAKIQPKPSELSAAEFEAAFGPLSEHSPWVATRTFDRGISEACDTFSGLAQALSVTLDNASKDEKLSLIRAHPVSFFKRFLQT